MASDAPPSSSADNASMGNTTINNASGVVVAPQFSQNTRHCQVRQCTTFWPGTQALRPFFQRTLKKNRKMQQICFPNVSTIPTVCPMPCFRQPSRRGPMKRSRSHGLKWKTKSPFSMNMMSPHPKRPSRKKFTPHQTQSLLPGSVFPPILHAKKFPKQTQRGLC